MNRKKIDGVVWLKLVMIALLVGWKDRKRERNREKSWQSACNCISWAFSSVCSVVKIVRWSFCWKLIACQWLIQGSIAILYLYTKIEYTPNEFNVCVLISHIIARDRQNVQLKIFSISSFVIARCGCVGFTFGLR